MINFFKRIRQRLFSENKFSKYLIYAIGEIVLVVIGILIALQINNWNEAKKERVKEINYLENLKTDLVTDLENHERFSILRFNTSKNCSDLLNSDSPTTIKETKDYTKKYEEVLYWNAFVPSNNTFKELLSSGNLNLIKNDSIKNALLELDKMNAEISLNEDHLRRDYEQYLYDITYKNITAFGFFDISEPQSEFINSLSIEDIPESQHEQLIKEAQWLYKNQTFINGLKLSMINSSSLANRHKNTAQFIRKLIKFIDQEI